MLSNGEKMRCDLARATLEPQSLFVFDEFTSVVDRNVAQIGSYAIQSCPQNQKQFIAVTCHYDVEEWGTTRLDIQHRHNDIHAQSKKKSTQN